MAAHSNELPPTNQENVSALEEDISVEQGASAVREDAPVSMFEPSKKLMILTCMDARLDPLTQIEGLKLGEAHVIRNAGGIFTDDALRSIIVSQQMLGTRKIWVYRHTDCGMQGLDLEELRRRVIKAFGNSVAPEFDAIDFHSFKSIEESLERDVHRLRRHPLVLRETAVEGHIYHLGKLYKMPGGETDA